MPTAEQRKNIVVLLPSIDVCGYPGTPKKNILYQSAFTSRTRCGHMGEGGRRAMVQPLKMEISHNLNGGEDCRDALVLPGSTRTCAVLLNASKGVELGLKSL